MVQRRIMQSYKQVEILIVILTCRVETGGPRASWSREHFGRTLLLAMALDAIAALVVIFYYLLISAVGVWAGRKLHVSSELSLRVTKSKSRKERRRQEQLYLLRLFLCDRKLSLCLGFMTMTATWVGGGYLNGTAEVVYSSGIIWCYAPLGYALSLVLGGKYFAKKIHASESITMIDPFQRRFGRWVVFLLIIPAVCGEMCWSAAILSALGATIEVGVGFHTSTAAIVVSSCVTLFYTALGGLYSVVYTDVFQVMITAVGMWYCVPLIVHHDAAGTLKNYSWVGHMSYGDMVVSLDFFLMTALGGISWQVYFQRVLSAESESVAKWLSYLGAFGCLFLAAPPMIMGAAAATTNMTKVGYSGPARLVSEDRHRTLPYIIHLFLPRFEAVLGMLAIMTAVMSSYDSSALSAATMMTRNVYQKLIRPKAGATELVMFLRASVVAFGGVATVLAMSVEAGSVYSLWVLSSDVVYVLLFPQLLAFSYYEEKTNAYGLLLGFILSGALRVVSGEPSLDVPVLLRFPFYDEVQGQIFPFRTFCMMINVVSIVLFSKLAAHLFEKNILDPKQDVFNSFPSLHTAAVQSLPAEDKQPTEAEEPTKQTTGKDDTKTTSGRSEQDRRRSSTAGSSSRSGNLLTLL